MVSRAALVTMYGLLMSDVLKPRANVVSSRISIQENLFQLELTLGVAEVN